MSYPHSIHEAHIEHPQKSNVWMEIVENILICPFRSQMMLISKAHNLDLQDVVSNTCPSIYDFNLGVPDWLENGTVPITGFSELISPPLHKQ